MEEIKPISIQVSGIESKDNKITLLQDVGKQYPVKYSFFIKKQDGTESKAYQQFLELGVSIGKVYEIAVKETQGVNKMSGKPVTYRNIAYFKTGTQQSITPTPKPSYEPPVKPQDVSDDFKQSVIAGFKVRDEIIKKLSARLHVCEIALIDYKGEKITEKASEFHECTAPREEIPEVFRPEVKIEDDVENIKY